MDNKLEKVNSHQVVSSLSGEEALMVDTALKVVTEIVNAVNDYAKCTQEQITERQRIRAGLKAMIAKIEADKEENIYTINKFYEDKKELYNFLEEVLINSQKVGDIEAMKTICDTLLKLQDSKIEELKTLIGSKNNFVNFIE